MNKALGKNNTIICVYERDLLFKSMKQKEHNLLKELADIIGIHKRIYAFDETLVTGTQAMKVLMQWISSDAKEAA